MSTTRTPRAFKLTLPQVVVSVQDSIKLRQWMRQEIATKREAYYETYAKSVQQAGGVAEAKKDWLKANVKTREVAGSLPSTAEEVQRIVIQFFIPGYTAFGKKVESIQGMEFKKESKSTRIPVEATQALAAFAAAFPYILLSGMNQQVPPTIEELTQRVKSVIPEAGFSKVLFPGVDLTLHMENFKEWLSTNGGMVFVGKEEEVLTLAQSVVDALEAEYAPVDAVDADDDDDDEEEIGEKEETPSADGEATAPVVAEDEAFE
jgi:hypothetical protein